MEEVITTGVVTTLGIEQQGTVQGIMVVTTGIQGVEDTTTATEVVGVFE